MSENRERRDEEEGLPDLPPPPELPETPRLRPKLPPRPKEEQDKDDAAEYRRSGMAYYIPAALVAPIVLLTLGGAWLDDRLHTSPWFTLGGALLGVIAGFINMIQIANKMNK